MRSNNEREIRKEEEEERERERERVPHIDNFQATTDVQHEIPTHVLNSG